MEHRRGDKPDDASNSVLKITTQSAALHHPSRRTLDDPAVRRHLEGTVVVGLLDDVDGLPPSFVGPLGKGVSAVSADDPHVPETEKKNLALKTSCLCRSTTFAAVTPTAPRRRSPAPVEGVVGCLQVAIGPPPLKWS